MIAALALDEGIVASRVLEGSFTHDTFIEYLCDDVVRFEIFILYQELILFWLPITTPFPGPFFLITHKFIILKRLLTLCIVMVRMHS